jgi:hypothetical protein
MRPKTIFLRRDCSANARRLSRPAGALAKEEGETTGLFNRQLMFAAPPLDGIYQVFQRAYRQLKTRYLAKFHGTHTTSCAVSACKQSGFERKDDRSDNLTDNS